MTNIWAEGYNEPQEVIVVQSLSEVKTGESCTIKWMFGAPAEYMRQYDIGEGCLVRVLRNLGDSVIIAKDNLRLAVCGEVAARIKV